MADNKFKTGEILKRFERMKQELPVQLANQAQRYFVQSFRDEAWDGKPWAVPKRRIEGTPEWKYPKKKGLTRRVKATLIMTGRLRRATNMSIRETNFDRVRLIVEVPYAGYLNDGTPKMPARKFMGQSPTLTRMQTETIQRELKKVFKP